MPQDLVVCTAGYLVCRQKYDIPPFSYAKSNRQVALALLHSDWATTNAEPLAPHIVSVGALTAAPAKALPSELNEWVESAGEAAIVYASLGTTAIPGIEEERCKAMLLNTSRQPACSAGLHCTLT